MPWSYWYNLGGNPLSRPPSVANNQDGRMEIFYKGINGDLKHIWQTQPGGKWSNEDSLGDQLSTPPAAGRNQGGWLTVFAGVNASFPDSDHLSFNYQTAPGNGWAWKDHLIELINSPPTSWLSVINNQADNGKIEAGRLELFYTEEATNNLVHIWERFEKSNEWTDTVDKLGGPVDLGPKAASNGDGRLEVFTAYKGVLKHTWQTVPQGGWSDLEDLGIGYGSETIAVGRNGYERLEVFARHEQGPELYHIWQTGDPAKPWSDWVPLDGAVVDGPPFVIRNGKGWLEVFIRGIDTDLLHIKQTGDPDNPWSKWESLGRPQGNLPVPRYDIALGWNYPDGTHPYGRLEVFVVEGDHNDIWHTWET